MVRESIINMFSFRHKLHDRVPSHYLTAYEEIYLKLLEEINTGKLPAHEDYLGGNELAGSIYRKKYFLKDNKNKVLEERPEDVFLRVASFLAAVEKENQLDWARQFYNVMFESFFLPGGRVLAGAGDLYRMKTLANCYTTIIEDDSIEGIYKAAYEAARTYSFGGGIGVDISVLRPKGSIVHNAADTSTGAVSFMELYSLTTGLIGQSGRRGALLIAIDVKHPDIFDFIDVKSKPSWLTKDTLARIRARGRFSEEQLAIVEKSLIENQVRFANISIKFTDEFFQALDEQNTYGPKKILVYKKKEKGKIMDIYQDCKEIHYSYGIPSKDITKYELYRIFDSIAELNEFLKKEFGACVELRELQDPYKRDVYGDYILETNKEYDLAIRFSGDFLLYFGSKEVGSIKRLVKAREIWNRFVESNYRMAEPGLIFWSKMKRYSPSDYVGYPIVCTNPCSEVPLEAGGACNLGSLNLSQYVRNPFTSDASIDYERLKEVIKVIVRLMDNVVEWNIFLHPLERQRNAGKMTRRIGIGIMGLADLFLQLGLAYDSEEALKTLEELMAFIANHVYQQSAKLAAEKGIAPIFDYERYSLNPYFREALWEETKELIRAKGLRNVALLSIAPTGTLSNIAKSFTFSGKNYIGVSGGIEPVFALYYTRRSESLGQTFKIFHSTIQAYIDMKGIENASYMDIDQLKKVLPSHFFRTAHVIDPIMRVRIQATAQKYIDHSISSTVNLPEDIHPEVISDIYIAAWKYGLKGITIYRDGSRFPILSSEKEQTEFQKMKDRKFKLLVDGKLITARGDEIIALPSGKLTTVYHLVKMR